MEMMRVRSEYIIAANDNSFKHSSVKIKILLQPKKIKVKIEIVILVIEGL